MSCRAASLSFAILLATSVATRAQTGSQSTVSVRLFGGTSASEPMLWSIARQPILVPGTEQAPVYDTLQITRSITPGLTFGASMVYFPASLFGVQVGLLYQELAFTTTCAGMSFFQVGMRHDNEVLCDNIQGRSQPLHLFEFGIGGIMRVAPRHTLSPFASLGVGLADITNSTVYLDGADSSGIRIVINDPNPRATAWVVHFGGGISVALGSGYQFWFSGGESRVQLVRLTGPADHLAHAPTGTRFFPNAIFAFGIDIVLGGKRGRRY